MRIKLAIGTYIMSTQSITIDKNAGRPLLELVIGLLKASPEADVIELEKTPSLPAMKHRAVSHELSGV